VRTGAELSSRGTSEAAEVSSRAALGIIIAVMALPMFMTGGMLALFLGMEYATTSFFIGIVFLILGIVAFAVARRAPLPPPRVSVEFSQAVAVSLPRSSPNAAIPEATVKVECPSCGASPSSLGIGQLTHCEYCGAAYLVPGA